MYCNNLCLILDVSTQVTKSSILCVTKNAGSVTISGPTQISGGHCQSSVTNASQKKKKISTLQVHKMPYTFDACRKTEYEERNTRDRIAARIQTSVESGAWKIDRRKHYASQKQEKSHGNRICPCSTNATASSMFCTILSLTSTTASLHLPIM